MRLVRLIQVRKLLFIRAILALEDDNLSKRIFIERANNSFDDENNALLSEEWSIVDDLLKVAAIFKLNNEVRNMTTRGHVYPKSVWKKMVWDRGWSLEDTHWCLEARLHRELDLLIRIYPKPRYLTWWSLSNKYPGTIRMCEVMAKFLSHASLLKCEDVWLKHLPRGNRIYSLCDLYVIEDIFHITMQCPGTQQLRTAMFDEFEQYPDVREILTIYEHA